MDKSQSSGWPEPLVDEIWHLRKPSNDQPDSPQPGHVGINAHDTIKSMLNKPSSSSEEGEASSSSADKGVVRVVLYDFGIEYQHPGLQDRVDLERSRDFDHSLDPGGVRWPLGQIEDSFDAHGTACAGLVCGNRRHSHGPIDLEEDKRFIGVAPMCQVVSVRISTNFDLNSLIAALNYAKEAGDVILIPRALPEAKDLPPAPPDLREKAKALAADLERIAAKMPVVCASGNDGTSSLAYPASVPNVIAVGACNDRGYRSTYSQYGKGLTLVAPSDDEQCEHEDLSRLSQEEAEERVEQAKQEAKDTYHRAQGATERADEARDWAKHAEQASQQAQQMVQGSQQTAQAKLASQQSAQWAKQAKEHAEQASQQAQQARQRAHQATQLEEQAWARAEHAWLRVKLASLRAQKADSRPGDDSAWVLDAMASLPEEQDRLQTLREGLERRQGLLARRQEELLERREKGEPQQQEKGRGLHEAAALYGEREEPEPLQRELSSVEDELKALAVLLARGAERQKQPSGEVKKRAREAKQQAMAELERRAEGHAGLVTQSATQAGAAAQYPPQGHVSGRCLDRWNVERFGLRTIATTDNQGPSGYNPDPALDYCKMTGNFGFGGTSAAAAQVAGVVALMLTANLHLKKHHEAGKEVKRLLCETVNKASLKPEPKRGRAFLTETEKEDRFILEFGAGLVDAARAVAAAKAWRP